MQMSLFWINNKTRWVTRDREWQMPKEKPAKDGKEHYISIKFESRPKRQILVTKKQLVRTVQMIQRLCVFMQWSFLIPKE